MFHFHLIVRISKTIKAMIPQPSPVSDQSETQSLLLRSSQKLLGHIPIDPGSVERGPRDIAQLIALNDR